jgi:FlaA1/EpsC-like NDP-sugar epimerase
MFSLRPATMRAWASLPLLALLFAGVYYVAWWLRFEGNVQSQHLANMRYTLPCVVIVEVAVFCWFRSHNLWIRYVTFHDLIVLGKAATTASVVNVLCDYILYPDTNIPRSVFLMNWGAVVVAVGSIRSLSRLAQEKNSFFDNRSGEPVLIVGANDAGESLLRAIRRNKLLQYRVVGFITNDSTAVGSQISGIPVVGTLANTCELAERHGANEVFITAGALTGKQVRQLVYDGEKCGVKVRVLPSYEEILNENITLSTREVSIEDLLRRVPVNLDQSGLHRWIDGNVLMITGSAGSIGSEICRQLLRFRPKQIVLVDRSESGQFFLDRELCQLSNEHQIEIALADCNDRPRMQKLFEQYQPNIVFHAAAYKHVPLMEQHCGEAVKNIVLLTKQIADLAAEHDVNSFVMISSDKAVNPTNVMGACKRVAELYVQSLNETTNCDFVTVRFGNVLDSAGSVIPIFRKQIAQGGPVTVTHPDMTRYFMTIPEASQLVIQAGAMGQGGEIFVLDMGDPVRIVDLASDLIRLSGLRVDEDIEIQFIGTRPGEKLYEELRVDGENHVSTTHPKITVVDSNLENRFEIHKAVTRLRNLTEFPNDMIVDELVRIVPQFHPNRRKSATTFERAA